ncbi:YiiD C-terminal domain-containing protein [Saccharospirillum mangrovi]|uniref:YiiD C-terminal domain-containing protein n=1 Tax=Saccharospirillum mangrovi TaxID=2161747 RepID=UPI000D366AEB|nr:YiiD C-terminal domain-containing protein [Saccharospirillum mangrovi]
MKLDRIEPLAALGIELLESTATETRFRIPLVGNRNDKGSLFAGSQYAALVLTGWYHSGAWAEQHGLGDTVAIRDGQVRYPKPALSDVIATARFTAEPDLRPSGHWRALVQVQAHDTQQQRVAELNADYRILVG